ncbi:EAL domain-containing response regulator [Vibrio zhanjiangensis]|nr:EAL domain-containing response regulator [Vibrio zhanjiangensis]
MADGNRLLLIVDDQDVVRHTLKLCLKNIEYENVVEARDGREAKKVIAENDVDIIFCDLNMPVEDGFEVLRYLGEIGFKGSVILISGEEEELLSSSSNLARLYQLDILGSVQKPVSAGVVKKLIAQIETSRLTRLNAPPVPVLSANDILHHMDVGNVKAFFQPQMDLATRRVSGLEVLARIVVSDSEVIYPDSFIPAAEKSLDLIQSLTKVIIKEALSEISQNYQFLQGITFALNISAKVLEDPQFPYWLNEVVVDYKIPQENIICELTETALTHEQTTVDTQLLRLKILRFKISIDDFGTGYSSIAQLHSIPFDEIKVDKRFVLDCISNLKSRAILEQSICMAKAMGISVVAEGVENRDIENFLISIGCHIAQGFLYSRPDTIEPIVKYIRWTQNMLESG